MHSFVPFTASDDVSSSMTFCDFLTHIPPLSVCIQAPKTFPSFCRGTEEHAGLGGKVDIINSTLGKALGGAAGGYTTGPKELISLLRQRSRPYLFSNSLPPPVVAGASKVSYILHLINCHRNRCCPIVLLS